MKAKLKESLNKNLPLEVLQKYQYIHCNMTSLSIRFDSEELVQIYSFLQKNHNDFQSTNLENRILDISSNLAIERDKNEYYDPEFPFIGSANSNLEINLRYLKACSWPVLFFLLVSKSKKKIFIGKVHLPLKSGKKQVFFFEVLNYQNITSLKSILEDVGNSKNDLNGLYDKVVRNLTEFYESTNSMEDVEMICRGYIEVNFRIVHQNLQNFNTQI